MARLWGAVIAIGRRNRRGERPLASSNRFASVLPVTKLAEIQSAIRKLPPRERTELRRWVLARADEGLDAETDSADLEAELLKVEEESFRAYSRDEIRSVCERVVREVRRP